MPKETCARVASLAVIALLGCAPQGPARPGADGSQRADADSGSAADVGPGPDLVVATDAGADSAAGLDAPAEKPDPVFASPEIVAERLARMIWDAPAGADVIAMLSAGVSRKAAGDAAARMLLDGRARTGVAAFFRWWLFPLGGPPLNDLGAALQGEAPAMGIYLTLDTQGTFAELLTAPYTFMNETLAKHYGVSGVSGPEFRRVPYPPGEPRIGLLTGAGVLSHFSSLVNPSWPAKRGWMVTDPLLCTPVIRSFLPIDAPDVTRSLRQQMLDATSGCGQACHEILNSPGFAYIGFDSDGHWHPEPGAAANETEGWIPATIMPDAPRFNGPAELARLLVAREETRRCFVRQWLQYAVKREDAIVTKAKPEDEDSIKAALTAFTASGLRLDAAIIAVAQTDTFLRAASP